MVLNKARYKLHRSPRAYHSQRGEDAGRTVDPGHHGDLHELHPEMLRHYALAGARAGRRRKAVLFTPDSAAYESAFN